MKRDLEYEKYKKYEVLYPEKERFDSFYKTLNKDSYSHRFKFENGYGASVIKHYGSYGFEKDLFELAVLFFEDEDSYGRITYNTSVTNDVLGFLNNEQVLGYLEKIKNLNEHGRYDEENIL